MVTALSHTGLVVRDMDKMVDFYQSAFGFEVILDTMVAGKEADAIVNFSIERERIVLLQLGDMQVEFLEYRPTGRGYPDDYQSNDLFGMHLAFATNSIEEDYAMLLGKGVTIISPGGPQTIPPEHELFAGTKVLYFQDPEGHPLELMQLPQ